MSKPIKELVRNEVARRFRSVTSLAVVDVTGIDAVSMNHLRARLAEKSIRLMVVKNALAKQAFKAAGQRSVADLLNGPCALAYAIDPAATSVVSVVRELLEIRKAMTALKVKAAVLEGDAFGSPQAVKDLSTFPTRQEALGRAVSSVLGAGAKLTVAILGPGSKVASLLKTIEQKAEKEAPAAEAPPAEAAPASP